MIVRRKQKGQAKVAIENAHEIDQIGGVAGIEVGGWLVGDHERRPVDDGARHRDALALAAGQQIGPVLRALAETHFLERFQRSPAAVLRSNALDQQRIFDVLHGREYRDQVEGLKNEADSFAAKPGELRRLQFRSIDAVDVDAAGGGLVDASDQVQERDLPLPLGPATATNSPRPTASEMSSSAVTVVRPIGNVRVTLSSLTSSSIG